MCCEGKCSVTGCNEKAKVGGRCAKHHKAAMSAAKKVASLVLLALCAPLSAQVIQPPPVTATSVSTAQYCADAGATDAYACSLPVAPTVAAGLCVNVKANTVNTGAASLNLNSTGAVTIVKVAGGVTTTLADNDIRAGQVITVCHDGTNFELQSTLGNAAAGGSGITVGSTTIASGTSTRVPYNNAGVYAESANLTNSGSTVTVGTGIGGTNRGANIDNGTSTGASLCTRDNGSDTWCFLDGGALDKASGVATFSLAGATRFEFQGSGISDWHSPSYGIFRLHRDGASDYQAYLAPGYPQTLTESSATGVLNITIPSGASGGVNFEYTVAANDGTDYQSRTGRINIAVSNKAGVVTCGLSAASEAADGSAAASPTGTLTYAITCTVSGNVATVKFNAVSSLTQTFLKLVGFQAWGHSSTTSGFSIMAAS